MDSVSHCGWKNIPMRNIRSKKIARAATRSSLLLFSALLFLVAFVLLDSFGGKTRDQQTTKLESINKLALKEQLLTATAADLPAILTEMEQGLADLARQVKEEPFLSKTLLGSDEALVFGIEETQTRFTHIGARHLALSTIGAKPSLSLGASPEDSASYAESLVAWENKNTNQLKDLEVSIAGLSPQIQSIREAVQGRSGVLANRLMAGKIGLVGLTVLFLIFAWLYNRARVFKPLRKVAEQTFSISEGDLASKVELDKAGAVVEIKEGVNQLVDNMRTAAGFAYSVGEGDLDAKLDLVQDEFTDEPRANLALALVHMRDRLRDFAKDDEKRKWAAEGLSYFVEILRADHSGLEAMGNQIISGLVNYLSANQGALYILEEPETGGPAQIRGLAAYAWGHPHNLKASFGVDEGLIGAAVYNNRSIYMTDLPEDYTHIRSGLGDAQPRNILITPLCINETVVGAIEIASFNILKDFEVDFIKKVSENIATSINGVQTRLKTQQLLVQSQELANRLTEQEQEVRHNLEKLESTQERMMANQMELDGVLSAIDKSMAMAEFELNGKLTEANNSFLKLTGYRLTEIRGKSHDELVPRSRKHEDEAKDLWASLQKGRFQRGEFNRVNAKGQEIWMHASYNPILGADAKPHKILLLAADITDQKLSALDFEGQIHAINQTNAVAEFDLDGNFLKVNSHYLHLTGFAESEFIGNHHRMVVPEAEVSDPAYFENWARLKQGEAMEGEYRLLKRSGEISWVRGSFNPIFGLEGEPLKIISVAVDITAQKKMEMQIKEQLEHMAAQEEELRQNMEEMQATHEEMQATHEEMDRNQVEMSGILSSIDKSMAMIEYDLEGKILSANTSFLSLTGYEFSEIEGSHHSVFLPEDEREDAKTQQFWDALLQGGYQQGNYKRLGKDGQEIWLNAVYNPIPGRDGLPYKIVQFATDITKRMQSSLDFEGQLNAINKSFLMAVFDMDHKLIRANQLFLDLTGYSKMTLMGQSHSQLLTSEDREAESSSQLWDRLAAGEFVNGEFRVLTGAGETKWVRGSYNPILDLNGEPFKVVWVSVEISEEKEMASRIQNQLGQMAEQEEELRNSFDEMQQTKELLEQRELEMSGQLHAIDSTLATIEYSPQGEIQAVNDIFLDITKYASEELVGKQHSVFVSEDRAESLEYKQAWRNLQKGISHSGEWKYRTSEGADIWMFSTVTPVLGRDGKPFKVIELATEITDRKLMNVDFEGQVTAINRANAVAEFSLEGQLMEANDSFLKMVRDEMKNLRHKAYRDFLPDEKKGEAASIWDKLASGNYVEGEYEWATDRELPLWVKGTFNPILDLDGKPFKIVLIANDITQQKMLQLENSSQLNMLAAKEMELRKNMRQMVETQEQLSRNEAEIRGQLNAIDATNAKVEFDLEGKIISANRIFLDISGYSEEEIMGQGYEALLFEEEIESGSFGALWEELNEGRSKAGEFKYRRQSGEELWVQATFTPILDKDEQPYKIMSLAADITERKRNENEIVEANEKLNQTLHELTSAQDRLILSEKMASLGQLIAGVAHEVNTPISAVKASVRNMSRILPHALRELPGMLSRIPEDISGIFTELVEKSVGSDITLTTKEERGYKKQIQAYLDEIGIENSYEIASSLVSIRVLDEIERFLPLIEQEGAGEYLDMAYRLGQLKVNMDNIDTAAEKTSKIVFALKSYTHVQSADKFVMTRLQDNLDLILTVYQNQLKYGVEVVRNYEDIPEVPVFPDELGQVWTNIVHNSIQAMKNEGKLTLDIGREGEFAKVSISDSGPGIPDDIKARIFEPFFTTKPQGEGTGLGLDICAKIIEKHGGRIAVDSEPGRTTFIVHLPFEQPEPQEATEEAVTGDNGLNGSAEQVHEGELVKVG